MRKMAGEVKKKISLLLVAVMLFGSIPQNGLTVSASQSMSESTAEDTQVKELTGQLSGEETTEEASGKEAAEEVEAEESVEQAPGEEATEESGEEEPAKEHSGEELTEEVEAEESTEEPLGEKVTEESGAEEASGEELTEGATVEETTEKESTNEPTAEEVTEGGTTEEAQDQPFTIGDTIVIPESAMTRNQKDIEVVGVKNGILTQAADTKATYTIKLNSFSTTNELAVETKDSTCAAAEITADGKLEVTIAATEENRTTRLIIYEKDDPDKTAVKGGEITVKSAPPAWITETPVIKLNGSTDTTLNLTFAAKNVIQTVQGRVYYKAVATPLGSNGNEVPSAAKTQYFLYEKANQEVSMKVLDWDTGRGHAQKYNVRVSLVQTKDANIPGESGNIVFTGREAVLKDAATKDPYYETKLSLKKMTSRVYTGQQNAVIAVPVFGKNTTYRSITEAKVSYAKITAGPYSQTDYKVRVEENKVWLSVASGAATGKLTIVVTAKGVNGMYPTTAELTVDIVKGIERISLTAPKKVYKAENKGVSFTSSIVYNGTTNKDFLPKTRKVTWKILDSQGREIDSSHKLNSQIRIKNGKVSIAKSYLLSSDLNEDTFIIRADAADYAGNTVYGEASFTVTKEPAALGEAVIVVKENDFYRVIARSGDSVSADKLNGAYVRVLNEEAKEDLDLYEAKDFLSADLYTLRVNNKAISLNSSGFLWTYKAAKNIKITATATDGSKRTTVLDKLTVNYAQSTGLALECLSHSDGTTVGTIDQYKENPSYTGPITFYGVRDEKFTIRIKDEQGFYPDGVVDHKLKVSGAKLLSSSPSYGSYTILGTGDTITLTLTDNAKKVTKTYVLKNLALGTKNALKVSTKDVLEPYTTSPQTITYTISGRDQGKYEYVLVSINQADAQKKSTYYSQLLNASQGTIGTVMPVEDGKVVLKFGGNTYVYSSNYKLNFSFGHIDENKNFIAETRETAVILKAALKKAAVVKLNEKYTLGVKEGKEIPLTLMNKKATLNSVYQLQNANIKGQPSQFTDFFELAGTSLRLKANAPMSEIKNKGITLTGWVTGYKYTDADGNTRTGLASRITITLKPTVSKYSITGVTVLENTSIEARLKVLANKKETVVAHVYTDDPQFKAEAADGAVKLTAAGLNPGSYKVKLYVMPVNSAYAADVGALKDSGNTAKYYEAIKKSSIELTAAVKIAARGTAAAETKFPETKAAFTADGYDKP